MGLFDAGRREWRVHAAWLALGIVVFELTFQPAFAAAAICLSVGIDDYRNGWWLFRRDPCRGRGWAMMLASWSLGGGRTAAWSFGAAISVGMSLELLGLMVPMALPAPMIAAFDVALIGFLWFMGLSLAWTMIARWAGVAVWLHGSSLTRARRLDQWPPVGPRSPIAATAGLVGVAMCPMILLLLLVAHWFAVPRPNDGGVIGQAAAWVGVLILLPFFGGRWALRAATPWAFECYPELMPTPPPHRQVF